MPGENQQTAMILELEFVHYKPGSKVRDYQFFSFAKSLITSTSEYEQKNLPGCAIFINLVHCLQ